MAARTARTPESRAGAAISRRPRGARRRRQAALLALALAGGCVTYDVDADPLGGVDLGAAAQPVRIVLPGAGNTPGERALRQYYSSIFTQMQGALVDRELDSLRFLLAQHAGRERAPDWAKEQLRQFENLAAVLEFEIAVTDAVAVELEPLTGAEPRLGEPLYVGVRVPAGLGVRDFELPGQASHDEDAMRFLVSWRILDQDAFGATTRREFDDVLTLERSIEPAREELKLRYEIPALRPEGVRRQVHVTVALAPGHYLRDGDELPTTGFELATREFVVWPGGVDSIRANPYAHLSRAVASGDPAHFGNLHVACWLMKPEFYEDALRRLVGGVRVGNPGLGRACAAGLRVLTGEELRSDDRDGWLRWWRAREEKRSAEPSAADRR